MNKKTEIVIIKLEQKTSLVKKVFSFLNIKNKKQEFQFLYIHYYNNNILYSIIKIETIILTT